MGFSGGQIVCSRLVCHSRREIGLALARGGLGADNKKARVPPPGPSSEPAGREPLGSVRGQLRQRVGADAHCGVDLRVAKGGRWRSSTSLNVTVQKRGETENKKRNQTEQKFKKKKNLDEHVVSPKKTQKNEMLTNTKKNREEKETVRIKTKSLNDYDVQCE